MEPTPSMSPALRDVAKEMLRARLEEGHTLIKDMGRELDLLQAGNAYAYSTHAKALLNLNMSAKEAGWPQLWRPDSWKPKGFRANLVRAAVFIIFAIEAYDARQQLRKGNSNNGANT